MRVLVHESFCWKKQTITIWKVNITTVTSWHESGPSGSTVWLSLMSQHVSNAWAAHQTQHFSCFVKSALWVDTIQLLTVKELQIYRVFICLKDTGLKSTDGSSVWFPEPRLWGVSWAAPMGMQATYPWSSKGCDDVAESKVNRCSHQAPHEMLLHSHSVFSEVRGAP